MESFQQTANRFRTLVDSVAVDSAMKNFQLASANLSKLSADLGLTMAKILGVVYSVTAGKGTLGRLLVDPALILRQEGLLAHADSLVLDVKNNARKYLGGIFRIL